MVAATTRREIWNDIRKKKTYRPSWNIVSPWSKLYVIFLFHRAKMIPLSWFSHFMLEHKHRYETERVNCQNRVVTLKSYFEGFWEETNLVLMLFLHIVWISSRHWSVAMYVVERINHSHHSESNVQLWHSNTGTVTASESGSRAGVEFVLALWEWGWWWWFFLGNIISIVREFNEFVRDNDNSNERRRSRRDLWIQIASL